MIPPRDGSRTGFLRLPAGSPLPAIARRIGLAIGIIGGVAVVLWFDRDGLRDNTQPGRPLGFSDVFYFTVVSLTTVGYGDITPFTEGARLVNAILLTPIRIFLWALFLGTAYELTVLRGRFGEEYALRHLREKLNGHVIVCGFGVTGRTSVAELLAHDQPRDQIVVIDPSEDAVAAATADGLVGFHGDAAVEALLRGAALDRAVSVLVAPNSDDTTVLICLTVRGLAPDVHLVASAQEEENIKHLYRAGADLVVSPSVSGGRLMAAAVRQRAVPAFLEDLLSFGGGVDAAEHVVTAAEAGRFARDLPELGNALILGVARGADRYPFHRLGDQPLRAGDLVVYLMATGPATAPPARAR